MKSLTNRPGRSGAMFAGGGLFLGWIAGLGGVPADRSLGLDAYRPVDTQTSGTAVDSRLTVSRMRVPEGFKVTLAAAEPEVRQPIATSYDDRGRLWVAESYSYNGSDFTDKSEDRILIFSDRDGDGVFESRTVFKTGLSRLTGVVWGFGGAWVLTAPTLSFIPDADGDDVPDREPIVHLDGWTLEAEHNSVNGLAWGPDGWLYGRHGNKEASLPGRPGQPANERVAMSCAIWRYHPVRHVFEVVADGTVNPWGLDWDELGQMFMSTSVMDHLWHVVPGAHFKRNAGVPVQAHVYEMMDSICEHSHRPKKAATLAPGEDDGGGGHSHVGTMIYLGDRWPEAYRGAAFLNNVLGHRVNQEKLVRDVATGRFLALHQPDFLKANDSWFRGVSLEYGPDGDVIVTDWSDSGECHDRDGVSRTTGRIYKITWGEPRLVSVALERASNAELIALQRHRNDWFVRHARRLLQERAASGAEMTAVHRDLRRMFDAESTAALKLRALWALHVTGGADREWLESLLRSAEESVRYWAVRLLVDDSGIAHRAGPALVRAVGLETTWLGRMALASALTAVDPGTRWELGGELASSLPVGGDPNLPRLIWSGWESAVGERPRAALRLALQLREPKLREWIARRTAEAAARAPELAAEILHAIAAAPAPSVAADLMIGAEAGLGAVVAPPEPGLLASLQVNYSSAESRVHRAALRLGARMGDDAALQRLRGVVSDARAPLEWRRQALQSLAAARPDWLGALLIELVARPEISELAIRTLASWDNPAVAPALLSGYTQFSRAARSVAIDTLIARSASVALLLEAVVAGRVPKADLSRVQIRQLASVNDPALRNRVEQIFGSSSPTSEAVAARIRKLRFTLKDAAYMRTADTAAGNATFVQRCSACHTLFGQGGKIGPDLTGSGRKDLDYLLTNIIDPNASISAEWRLVVANLTDGQVVSGSVVAEHESSVVLQTAGGPVTLERAKIRSLERLATSLMSTGLLDDLRVDQVRDLFGLLMADSGSTP